MTLHPDEGLDLHPDCAPQQCAEQTTTSEQDHQISRRKRFLGRSLNSESCNLRKYLGCLSRKLYFTLNYSQCTLPNGYIFIHCTTAKSSDKLYDTAIQLKQR